MQAIRLIVAVTMTAVWLAACAMNVAPRYDASLLEGLQKQNEKALILFAAVATGAPQSSYDATPYNEVIGGFDALRLQAQSRDVSPMAQKLLAQIAQGGVLAQVCGTTPAQAADCINASPRSIAQVVKILTQMKTQAGTQGGLAADLVTIWKTQYETAIQQALTVETALKRD